MDPDEQSYEQEEDQDDESAFGLYGVEDEAEFLRLRREKGAAG